MIALIMAGGLGLRLGPVSSSLPKPMLPLDDRPMLEHLVHQLASYRFERIVVATGHLAERIESHFDGARSVFRERVEFLREQTPLGTAGAIARLRDVGDAFLVTNGDVVTTLDFARICEQHKRRDAMMTIAMRRATVRLDLGLMDVDERGELRGFVEKPVMDYQLSMGVYVCHPDVRGYIARDERIDFPELIQRLLADGRRIVCYPSDDRWIHLTRFEDYERARTEFVELAPMLRAPARGVSSRSPGRSGRRAARSDGAAKWPPVA